MPYSNNRSDSLVDSCLTQTDTVVEIDFPGTAGYLEDWFKEVRPCLEIEINSAPSANPADGSEGFTFDGTLTIDCHVRGTIPSGPGTLMVSQSGVCESDIFVRRALIDGEVRGDIQAMEVIELESHARVTGNMRAPYIVIGPGAVYQGECELAPVEENQAEKASDDQPAALPYTFGAEGDELLVAALAG